MGKSHKFVERTNRNAITQKNIDAAAKEIFGFLRDNPQFGPRFGIRYGKAMPHGAPARRISNIFKNHGLPMKMVEDKNETPVKVDPKSGWHALLHIFARSQNVGQVTIAIRKFLRYEEKPASVDALEHELYASAVARPSSRSLATLVHIRRPPLEAG